MSLAKSATPPGIMTRGIESVVTRIKKAMSLRQPSVYTYLALIPKRHKLPYNEAVVKFDVWERNL